MIQVLVLHYNFCINTNEEDIKFTSEFAEKFKTLETAFKDLVPTRKLGRQFESFLIEHYGIVRIMTEKKFLEFVIKKDATNTLYGDFVKLTAFYTFADDL
jgi:hypothetical protein